MFKFDPSKLTVTYNYMKTVTTALGGSMHIVDPEAADGNQELIKVKVPFAVVRKFIKETKFTKYLKPVQIAVLRYENTVINIERDIASNILQDETDANAPRWVAKMETFVQDYLADRLGALDWYFDGRYVYNMSQADIDTLRHGGNGVDFISRDDKFRTMDIPCIDLYESNKVVWKTGVMTELRGVIAFSSGNAFAITPPIWKNVTAIGSSATVDTQPTTDNEDYLDTTIGITTGEERERILIDSLDQNYSLNLNFTMNTAKSISNIFGFDAVEPLQLPEIMLALTTVNIPGLPKFIKSTFSIGLCPSHGLTWLMGLLTQAKTLEDFVVVRSAIKYLTSKGMFHKNATKLDSLFVSSDYAIPPQYDLSDVQIGK